jgi:hypothetical protein
MGYTHWFFVQLPDLTFRYVGEGRFMNFWIGKAMLPQVQPGQVRLVEVMLDLQDDLDAWLLHVEYRRFPVLESGYRDSASMELEHKLTQTLMGMRSNVKPGSPEHRWAKEQTANTYRWTPNADEARAIGDIVSRKAKRPVLGSRPLRLATKPARRAQRSNRSARRSR